MKEFFVPLKLWNELVPFSLYFNRKGELVWASDRILELWDTSLEEIDDLLASLVMLRPFRGDLKVELLPELTDMVLHLAPKEIEENVIRGQLYPYEDGWVFTGCPLVSSVEDIEKMGMDLHRFPLHMGTGEMLLANEASQVAYRDILEQTEKLRESEERFRLISEQSLVGIVILQDGKLKYANEQWAKVCEVTVGEMYGWGPDGFIAQVHPDDRALLIEQARKKQAGEEDVIEQYEWRLITPSGKTKWISIYSRTVPYFGKSADLCSLIDVTEQKNADSAKEKLFKTEAENKAKTEFLARVSHELRTPLNAIIGYSEMLLENSREEGAEHYSKDLGRILDASGHLLELINDILDMSKVETGKMELNVEDVLLEEIIAEVSSIMTPLMKANENQFEIIREFLPDLQISVDRTKLRQVLLNLLSNASKFTRKGKVTLKVEFLEEPSPEFIRFSVKDDGIGIEESKLTSIFRRFTQAEEDTALKYGGTGLGLPITKAFLNMMDGTIEVRSEIGEGSVFEVTLPVDFSKASLGS